MATATLRSTNCWTKTFATITDDAKREQGYVDLQKIIDDDAFAIYPFSENNIEVFRSNVQGYQYRPAWTKLLNYAGLYKD